MLKKENRLTKDKDFDNVFKKGASSYDKIIGIKAVVNMPGISRVGIMVGNKVSKKAVERNKIKRRLRAIVEAELENLRNGLDIVIIALPESLGKTSGALEQPVCKHFKRLKLYRRLISNKRQK